MRTLLRRWPKLALVGWFPLIYVLGLIRLLGTEDAKYQASGFMPVLNSVPVLWWPKRLYEYYKRN